MNSQFKKDFKKHVDSQSTGELTPGVTPRRYEPSEGTANLNKRIHKESELVDKYKNLPYSFSKPKTPKKAEIKICNNCDAYVSVNRNTVGVVCTNCKQYSSVREVSIEEKE